MSQKNTQTKNGTGQRAALGFRAHSGWAVLVAITGSQTVPSVIRRQRIELADHGILGSSQPYHRARPMELGEAEVYLRHCSERSKTMARNAVQTVVGELVGQGYEVTDSCILLGSGRTSRDLAAILASHPMIHTAEGEFFREALQSACEACGLLVTGIKERELSSLSKAALGYSAEEIERQIAGLGRKLGPPWRQDEKLCTLATWLVLTGSAAFPQPYLGG